MARELFINVMPSEIRAALTDDRGLVEILIERRGRGSLVGGVYLGRVKRVVAAISAAFVDIGLGRDGFLALAEDGRGTASGAPPVHEGEAVLVQVVKDATGTKGVQLSRAPALPGRYLVYAPLRGDVAASRRIGDDAERERLVRLVSGIAEPGEGFILRTAAAGAGADELAGDARQLRRAWAGIEEARAGAAPPARLHADAAPVARVLREHGTDDVSRVRVDDRAAYREALAYCEASLPALADRVRLHAGPEDMFERFGIEDGIARACLPRVDLPSGGVLVIEATEALTTVDVNSGRFGTAGPASGEAALRINLEAADEAARQIRLRNIAGLIVIDFMRMEPGEGWRGLLGVLEAALARDPGAARLLGRTKAGLVEVTRRRRRESLLHVMTEECRACGGRGRRLSRETACLEALRALKRDARTAPPGTLVLRAAPGVAEALRTRHADALSDVRGSAGRVIEISEREDLGDARYDIAVAGSGG